MKKILLSLVALLCSSVIFAQTPEEKAALKAAQKEAKGHLSQGMKIRDEVMTTFQAMQAELQKGDKANQGNISQYQSTIKSKALAALSELNLAEKSGYIADKQKFDLGKALDDVSSQLLNPELQKAASHESFDTLTYAKSIDGVANGCHYEVTYGNKKNMEQEVPVKTAELKLPKIKIYYAYLCMFYIETKNLLGASEALDKYVNYGTTYPEVANDPQVVNPQYPASQFAFNIYYTAYNMKDFATMDKYYDLAYQFDDADSHNFVVQSYVQEDLQKGDTISWAKKCHDQILKDPESSTSASLIQNLLAYYGKNNDVASMGKLTDEVLAVAPESKVANYGKGFVLFSQEKYDEALTYYNKCIEIDPNYSEAYYQCGTIYNNMGSRANRKINDDADKGLYTVKAKLVAGKNLTEAQERANNAAAKKANAESQAKLNAAVEKDVIPCYKKAIPYFEKVRELNPDNPEKWAYELSICYKITKDEAKYEEVKALDK